MGQSDTGSVRTLARSGTACSSSADAHYSSIIVHLFNVNYCENSTISSSYSISFVYFHDSPDL
jgi:hypothetical protein